MAIIRNERAQRTAPEPPETAAPEEEEIDYRWHPTEDEFTSPLTAEQWAELFGDASFAETDPAKAVRCLRDYGEPATFQQLSIRYRGTMGRYRRWLGEAAHAAGDRFGVAAPQKDQFGMDEWWPLLYLTRATGKPGAGVFEMQLRPEVEQAFELIEEQERQAKRAENARQLQRIEQLERARREERERHAAEAAKTGEQATPETPAPAGSNPATVGPHLDMMRTVAQAVGVPAPSAPATEAPEQSIPDPQLIPLFPALNEFLGIMAQEETATSRYVQGSNREATEPFDATGPLDYALRYAERLRSVLALVREGNPRATAAAVARAVGDDTVSYLQSVLNGQEIPTFAYVDALKDRLFINPEHLEATEGMEDTIPVFCTYQELLADRSAQANLGDGEKPCEIAYVVDDSDDRRTGVILRFSALRCVLLTRVPVKAEAKRADNDELGAFVRLVDELDTFARTNGIARTSHSIHAEDWDKLAAGHMWPGTLI